MKHDFSTWPTKAQAAEAIGVSTKTIEKLADAKKLQAAKWKRPETGATVSVYHPGDVERLRKERNPAAPPFVMPAADNTGDTNVGSEGKALAIRQPSAEQFMRALAAGLASSQSGSESSKNRVPLAERLYLTVREASDLTGLGVSHLHKQIAAGKLKVLKGAGPHGAAVVRRADLAKL